jgi:predicted MFS family arabinose efflux permease
MATEATTSQQPQSSTQGVIFLLALAAFASSSAFRVCDPLLPLLAREFAVGLTESSYVVTSFSVAYGVLQFFYGPLADRYGKFRTLSYATLGCAVGSLIVATAPSLQIMVFGRFLAGATAAGIVPLSMAWIGDHVPYERRQATLAQFITGTIFGVSLGQLMGGVFADTLGWRAAFYALAATYVTVGLLLLSKLKTVPEKKPVPGQDTSLLGSIKQVLAVRWARVILLTVFTEGALVFGSLAFVPSYLQDHHGVSPSTAGIIGGMFAIGALIYVFQSNSLVQRLGERKMAQWGGFVMAIAYTCYWASSFWPFAALASLLLGFGFYLLHAVLQTNATQMAPAVRGTAVSLFASFLFMGQSIGVSLNAWIGDSFGLVWVFVLGAAAIPALALLFAQALLSRRAAAGAK